MSTSQVKNSALRLNGQNLRLAAKYVSHSKTPDCHLSTTHGEEAAEQVTAPSAPLDSVPLKLPLPEYLSEVRGGPTIRPLKFAPLSDQVVKSRRQKLQSFQREAQGAFSNPPQMRPSRPQLTRLEATEASRSGNLEEVQCRGTRAHLSSKPVPAANSRCSLRGKAQQRDNGSGKRLRLRREQHLDEDQADAVEEGKLEVRGARCILGIALKGLLDIPNCQEVPP